jgi:gamma-glutamyltranspeptidase/glutathione hydrolase
MSLTAGRRLVQSDLALALSLIEQEGRDGFYLGETAVAIENYCRDNGGRITTEDLKAYNPFWREPVRFRFRQLDIYAAGLPSSGGVVMGQILSILEQYELERYTADSPGYIHIRTGTLYRRLSGIYSPVHRGRTKSLCRSIAVSG